MYTVSQILDRALRLSDMDNSNVVNYQEKNQYLDQAWRNINQKMINHGVKYFYSEVPVAPGFNDLPWDFYQIDSIKSQYGYNLPRHKRDDSNSTPSYDIIGNKLFIYGYTTPNLTLKYWKKPITLTFPNKPIEVDIPTLPSLYSVYGDKIVYVDNNIYIYDILRKETKEQLLEEGTTITTLLAGRGSYYIEYNNDSLIPYRAIISYKGNILYRDVVEDGDRPVVFSDDSLGYAERLSTGYKIHSWKNNNTITIDVTEPTWEQKPLIKQIGDIWTIQDNNGGIYDYTTLTLLGNGDYYTATIFDENPALLTEYGIFWNIHNHTFQEDIPIHNKVLGILKADITTGYGFLTTDGEKTYIESFIPDTLLDFPNTVLYDYLAYSLAYLFSLKIGANNDNLEKAVSLAEHNFFDSLDANSDYPVVADTTGGSLL